MDQYDLESSKHRKHIAIDGKTVRNSSIERPVHIVTAWLARYKISLGQVTVEEKSNEITAMPKLVEELDIQGAVITCDAMG